jgi:hypothetical protein
MESIIKLFDYYKQLGEGAVNQLTNQELFSETNEFDNSIPVIMKHLWGNMLSRWTDFLETDGEKTWRKRDEEFIDTLIDREDLMKKWSEGWVCLFNALNNITDEDLIDRKVKIRNQDHSIMEAIHRQLAHYAYHVGQIVFIAKHIKGKAWKSLSIPKNQSESFNQNKFNNKPSDHFTDDFRTNKL